MSSPVTTPVTVVPKVSWLKKFGQDVLKVLGFVATKVQPIAQVAGQFVAAIEPALAPEINVAENLISKIANQAAVTEAAMAAVGQASNGTAKLQAVLNAVGPEINSWVASAFPGAIELSQAAQAGLVNAVVAILNEVDGNLALTTPTAAAVAASAAAVAAVAASK